MLTFRSTVAAMALLASLGLAHAQTTQPAQDPHHPDATTPAAPAPAAPSGAMGMDKMMGDNMEQMMRSMMATGMGPMGPAAGMAGLRHIEGQIAFYKAELHITDAQASQWNAFADALRAGGKQLQAAYKGMLQGNALPSAPEQLVGRRQLLTTELETLQTIEPAARALYAAFSAEQKKAADELMADHLRRM
jgi:LTXXQ motif family protein